MTSIDYRTCPNLARLFFDQAARLGDRPLLWAKRDGAWQPTTWREAATAVTELACGLSALGIRPGDRVALVSENRPEWVLAELAIIAAGAISVPAYVTNTAADHRHILANSGARGAVVSTPALAAKVVQAAREVPGCDLLVTIDPFEPPAEGGVTVRGWRDVLALGAGNSADLAAIYGPLARTDLACIIHTSGTGGLPKGVALTHGSILHNCLGAYDLLLELGLGDEVFLSFLPLSHSYEHTCGLYFPISIGAQVYFAEGVEALAANMIEVRPTIMTAVPRLYETMHQRIGRAMSRSGGFKARLFETAVALGTKRYERPETMTLLDRLTDLVVDRLVRDKVRARFGGRLKALVSGGAPLNYDIGLFFTALGVRLLQGYGQTEAGPVISANPPRKSKLKTVGPPLAEVEVRIADDGEILVRGELVMRGYWNDDKATAEALRDGWLHTGDIGEIDVDGYIRITDRKKDIIKNSGGDMVSPARIEGMLAVEPEIAQAMVFGDRRPYLVALIVPAQETIDSWSRKNGVPADLAALSKDAGFHKHIERAVARVNAKLSVFERVRRFAIAHEPFSIANEMMTPTLKIRRHKINAVYRPAFEALYEIS